MHYLSKSDYKVGHDCPTKLFYKKMGYPSLNEEDEYLQYLAKGGYMVGKLATLHFPEGIEIDTGADHQKAVNMTKEYLKKENTTLFEAAIESKGKLIRMDILEKKGDVISLIEVKSKSYETTSDIKKKEKIEKELEEYILDVAFQYYVLAEAYPQWIVNPYLLLPDKAKNTQIENLPSYFNITEPSEKNARFRKYNVLFTGNVNEIINDDLLTKVDVKKRVLELQDIIKKETAILIESLKKDILKIETEKTKECFKCEYKLTDEKHLVSGYHECWKDNVHVKNHISDLYYMGSVGGYKKPLANELIKKRLLSLEDIPINELGNGIRAERQKIQIQYTKENKEWIASKLKDELLSLPYPLYFIDFETTIAALPFHKGMRPYETICFQWSCHIIERPGNYPIHKEWINLEQGFPSFRFAESLMDTIGADGTFLIWSQYEITMLKTIYEQYIKYNYHNIELLCWLEKMIKNRTEENKYYDMNEAAINYYFHPKMKGKTSIKWTLPAVLQSYHSPDITDLLINFEENLSLYKKDENSVVVDPYKLLPAIDIYEKAETINDGTGAMTAYGDIVFGLHKGEIEKVESYKKALLRYCKLDTLAMVIIWKHWTS